MPVIYGGVSIRPTPYVVLNKTSQTLGDGRQVGSTTTATLKGSITSTKTGDVDMAIDLPQRLSVIIHKQAELRSIFQLDGQWLEIQGLDGSAPEKFIAFVDSIEFDDGPWLDVCPYTITLHGESMAGEEGPENNHVESASESWQYEEGDGPHTYRVTHSLQAKGKTYDNAGDGTISKQAWEWAKDFVTNKLGLGWSTTTADFSPKSGHTIFDNGSIQPEAEFTAYNRIITENVDETDGTYSVTETLVLSKNNYWEEYTIAVRKETGNNLPLILNTVSINGVIHGLTVNLHDPEGRLVNALAAWNTIKPTMYTRASSYLIGITLNIHHTLENVDINTTEGTISYQYEYDDRVLINDTYEYYNIIQESSIEDGKTNVRIDGTIIGARYITDIYDPYLPYQRANTQFQFVKNLMFARCLSESGVPDLKPFPLSASITPDKQAGSVSYSFAFDNRLPELVRDEPTIGIRFSREDGRTIINISGTVVGLRAANATWPFGTYNALERYHNALSYFNGIKDNMIGLASTYVDVSKVNPVPYNSAISHIPRGGQITYEYEYNSMPAPCIPGALSENITITDDAATPVVAVIPVLGEPRGPVMQPIGTITEKRRTLTVEIIMPTSFLTTNLCSPPGPPDFDVSPYAPKGNPVYISQDQTQWSPAHGALTRTVSWIYK